MPRTSFNRAKQDDLKILILGYVKASGKNSTEISEMAGCSRPTLSKKMNDPTLWTLGELRALRKGLGIPEEKMLDEIHF